MSGYWLWLDLEMTGLDPQADRILEAAAIVTRVLPEEREAADRLETVAEFATAVFQPQEVLDTMDDWNRKTHGESGLIARVPQGISEAALDAALCELVDRYWAAPAEIVPNDNAAPAETVPNDNAAAAGSAQETVTTPSAKASGVILCGNSIGQDRKFVDRYLPQFASRLHYRMLDVSSFKIVYQELYGCSFKKSGTHRALDDILESIAELQFYLKSFSNSSLPLHPRTQKVRSTDNQVFLEGVRGNLFVHKKVSPQKFLTSPPLLLPTKGLRAGEGGLILRHCFSVTGVGGQWFAGS